MLPFDETAHSLDIHEQLYRIIILSDNYRLPLPADSIAVVT
jgi:hypothetical protein